MPSDLSPNLTTEIEALKAIYAAINRNDIPGVLQYFDPEIERVEFEGLPMAGTYRGLAEVGEHFSRARSTWAEGACEPERFVAAGDKVVVFVRVRVCLKSRDEWIEGSVGDVFTFRDGKVTVFRSFAEMQDALAWAGVEE